MSRKIKLENYEEFKIFLASHTREETARQFNLSKTKIDRLRVELKIPRKTFKYRELPVSFTDEQMSIIIGSLLGDGSLDLVGRHGKSNSKFAEVHSEKQLQWLEWKCEKLKPFSTNVTTKITDGRKNINGKVIKDTTKKLSSCRLETVVHPIFTELEQKWYLRNKNNDYVLINGRRVKTIPEELTLTPDVVSVWFLDDGSNNPKNRQAVFNTQSFCKLDCDKLVDKLKSISINCGTVKNRDKFIIQTRVSSYLNLIDMVTAKTPECLKYKTDLSSYKPPDYSTRYVSQGKTHRQL